LAGEPTKVFISWSGEASRKVAEALHAWLPRVLQAISPWFSPEIEKGRRWSEEIVLSLRQSRAGIACITPDNRESAWLHFEAGALARDAELCTFLHGVAPADVDWPLAQFQHTIPTATDVGRLAATLNRHLAHPLSESLLSETVAYHWPLLESALTQISPPAGAPSAKRSDRDLLEELVELARGRSELPPWFRDQTHYLLIIEPANRPKFPAHRRGISEDTRRCFRWSHQ
jgi:hypothetical protein